jgi:hypothetical protein
MNRHGLDELIKKIVKTAKSILPEFKNVEDGVNAELSRMRNPRPTKGMSDGQASTFMVAGASSATVGSNYVEIKKEPFIASVRVEEDGVEKLYLICRNYVPPVNTLASNSMFVNRNAAKGRVAAAEVGKEILIKHANSEWRIKVLEKNIFRPVKGDEWDAIQNKFQLISGMQSIESLKDFLLQHEEIEIEQARKPAEDEVEEQVEDPVDEVALIDKLEQEELERIREQLSIKEGMQREIIGTIALRDQPILDENQDSILRSPLPSQIIVTGAPGTGKTTILVQRISLKSKVEFLEDEEKVDHKSVLLNDNQLGPLFDTQGNNWLLFTPSDLLKVYLKEALNKEDVAAQDNKMKTWDTVRMQLARPEVLNIIKVGSTGGLFQRTRNELLPFRTNSDWTRYTKKFQRYLVRSMQSIFEEAIKVINSNKSNSALLRPLESVRISFRRHLSTDGTKAVAFLISELTTLREQYNELRQGHNKVLNALTNSVIKNSGQIQIISQLVSMQKSNDEEVDDDVEEGILLSEDEEELENKEELVDANEILVKARKQLQQTLAWYVSSLAKKTETKDHEKYTPILKLISSSLPDEDELIEIGQISLELQAFSRIMQGYNAFFSFIPSAYRRFRDQEVSHLGDKISQEAQGQIKALKISESEIDILIYTMLRYARSFFDLRPNLLSETTTGKSYLENIKDQYFTQVMVDEATDFSAVQLGCMFNLSHPYFSSVALSGDLMQRVTSTGITSWDNCQFFCPDFEIFPLEKVYRQSPQLLEVAKTLYENVQGEPPRFYSAFAENSVGFSPLMFKGDDDTDKLCSWLVSRIIEIYKANDQQLPSIALFVPEESQIDEVFEWIQDPLGDNGFLVEKCPEGKIGDGAKIRIFSVEYIKGLEFEGVFFLGVDQLDKKRPGLIDKYLYVGLTRAGHFLAVTYNKRLPNRLDCIEHYFSKGDWNEPVLGIS